MVGTYFESSYFFLEYLNSLHFVCRYFGNVFEIKARGPVPKLNVEYDDKVQQLITYSSEDVVKLQEASDGSMHAINGSTHGQYIGYSPPKNLCIGDLVDVRTLNREKWYRGRVAKVNQKQNTCSVAYDDEDVCIQCFKSTAVVYDLLNSFENYCSQVLPFSLLV